MHVCASLRHQSVVCSESQSETVIIRPCTLRLSPNTIRGLYWQYQQRLPCLVFLQFALKHHGLSARKGSWNNYNNNNSSHIRLRKSSSVPLFPQIVSFYIPPFTSPSTFDSSGFCWQYQQRLACLIFLYNPLWHNAVRPVMEVKFVK